MTKPKGQKNSFVGSGLTPDELTIGRIRYNEYKTIYPQLNKLSNSQLLEELVWLEVVQERLKKSVGIITAPAKGVNGEMNVQQIPKHLQESIADGLAQIIALKTKLGLFEDQKTTDAFKEFEILKTKAAKYREENPLSFKCTCFPKGTKISLVNREVKNIEDIKIGDEILGVEHCGKKDNKVKIQKVLDFIPRGKKQVIKLTSLKGRELICTSDHRIYASETAKSNSFAYLPAIDCLNKKIKIVCESLVNDRIIKIEIISNEEDVFDITTETQNFIANEILVHNCPFCTKIFFLKRRTTNYEEFISPFYADDKVVRNDELHSCWKEGFLPKDRYAKCMGVSPDYIDWLDEHFYQHKQKK